jgi:predicted CXXCH cytochrome family protein
MRNRRYATTAALCVLALGAMTSHSEQLKRLDPAAWGSDHVGKPVPEYTTGDECLFCHREKIGAGWGANRHNLTIRPLDPESPAAGALRQPPAKEFADAVRLVLGGQHRQRFLKPSKEYGKLDLLSVEWVPPRGEVPGKLVSVERPHWNAARFADSCAGCHTTAVDPKEKAFSAVSLDCFACHGSVPAEHAKKPELAYLSPKRKDEARVVTSICAQCHVRTGRSKETGRRYPTNFVAGDNLFRDFRADFSDAALTVLSSADRHVMESVRDVVVFGREAVTCLSCHDVHGRSSKKHHRVPEGDNCLTCHNGDGPKRDRKPFSTFSKTCGY